MARPITEANKLPAPSVPWARQVTNAINSLAVTVENFIRDQTNKNRATASNAQLLSNQVAGIASAQTTLAGQQLTLAGQQASLAAAAVVQTAESTASVTGFSGFSSSTSRPAVTVTTASGRIKVDFGGSLNSGNGYFVFSATGDDGTTYMNRITMQQNPAQRIALSGGASFTPSAFKSQVFTTTPGATVTLTLQYYAETSSVYFLGGSISAQPLL